MIQEFHQSTDELRADAVSRAGGIEDLTCRLACERGILIHLEVVGVPAAPVDLEVLVGDFGLKATVLLVGRGDGAFFRIDNEVEGEGLGAALADVLVSLDELEVDRELILHESVEGELIHVIRIGEGQVKLLLVILGIDLELDDGRIGDGLGDLRARDIPIQEGDEVSVDEVADVVRIGIELLRGDAEGEAAVLDPDILVLDLIDQTGDLIVVIADEIGDALLFLTRLGVAAGQVGLARAAVRRDGAAAHLSRLVLLEQVTTELTVDESLRAGQKMLPTIITLGLDNVEVAVRTIIAEAVVLFLIIPHTEPSLDLLHNAPRKGGDICLLAIDSGDLSVAVYVDLISRAAGREDLGLLIVGDLEEGGAVSGIELSRIGLQDGEGRFRLAGFERIDLRDQVITEGGKELARSVFHGHVALDVEVRRAEVFGFFDSLLGDNVLNGLVCGENEVFRIESHAESGDVEVRLGLILAEVEGALRDVDRELEVGQAAILVRNGDDGDVSDDAMHRGEVKILEGGILHKRFDRRIQHGAVRRKGGEEGTEIDVDDGDRLIVLGGRLIGVDQGADDTAHHFGCAGVETDELEQEVRAAIRSCRLRLDDVALIIIELHADHIEELIQNGVIDVLIRHLAILIEVTDIESASLGGGAVRVIETAELLRGVAVLRNDGELGAVLLGSGEVDITFHVDAVIAVAELDAEGALHAELAGDGIGNGLIHHGERGVQNVIQNAELVLGVQDVVELNVVINAVLEGARPTIVLRRYSLRVEGLGDRGAFRRLPDKIHRIGLGVLIESDTDRRSDALHLGRHDVISDVAFQPLLELVGKVDHRVRTVVLHPFLNVRIDKRGLLRDNRFGDLRIPARRLVVLISARNKGKNERYAEQYGNE